MKKHLSVLLMLCCIAINLFAPHWASAAASEYYSKRLSDLVGLSEQNYYVDEQLTDKVAIIDLFCQNKRIEIDEAYMVEFVDIIGTMKNHIYVNLSSLVKVTFDNPTIAEYNKGRIKGLKRGETKATFYYETQECSITVVVKKDYNPEISVLAWAENGAQVKSIPGTGPGNVLSRAYEMKNVKWKLCVMMELLKKRVHF